MSKQTIVPRQSISKRINPRLQRAFRGTEEVIERTKTNTENLETVAKLTGQNFETQQALKREYVKLTTELQDMLKDLEMLNLSHHLATTNLGEIAEMMATLIYRYQEDQEVDETVRQELAQLTTLLLNLKVFMTDPGELAALLREVDDETRQAALDLLDKEA